MIAKHKGKWFTAEGKSWDDPDSDDEVEYGNFDLMVDSPEPSISQISFMIISISMSLPEYKQTVNELSI